MHSGGRTCGFGPIVIQFSLSSPWERNLPDQIAVGRKRDEPLRPLPISRFFGKRALTRSRLNLADCGGRRHRTAFLFLVPFSLRLLLFLGTSLLTFRHGELPCSACEGLYYIQVRFD
jgi:hypothetical protein